MTTFSWVNLSIKLLLRRILHDDFRSALLNAAFYILLIVNRSCELCKMCIYSSCISEPRWRVPWHVPLLPWTHTQYRLILITPTLSCSHKHSEANGICMNPKPVPDECTISSCLKKSLPKLQFPAVLRNHWDFFSFTYCERRMTGPKAECHRRVWVVGMCWETFRGCWFRKNQKKVECGQLYPEGNKGLSKLKIKCNHVSKQPWACILLWLKHATWPNPDRNFDYSHSVLMHVLFPAECIGTARWELH